VLDDREFAQVREQLLRVFVGYEGLVRVVAAKDEKGMP
jgi:hypothetical protein